MSTATLTRMAGDEFLALPEDGVRRWLIDGEVREVGMTVRNRTHSRVMSRCAQHLGNWSDTQPEPRGGVFSGEAGFRLRDNPERIVGVDVAYVSPEVLARQNNDSALVVGVPTLVVEILSPSDTIEDINDKIEIYLEAGVSVVWIIDPRRRTVTVHRSVDEPTLVNARQELIGGEELPGFRVAVAQLFI